MRPTKICRNCNACKKLYLRTQYRLGQTKYYYCQIYDDFTETENSCVNWRKKIKQLKFSAQRFDQAEKDLNKLIELLKKE